MNNEITKVLNLLYTALSGPKGRGLSVDVLQRLFHKSARLVRTEYSDDQPNLRVMSRNEYFKNANSILTAIDFYEAETDHEILIYGNISHVISRYEAFSDPEHQIRLKKGANLIQLVRTIEGWKILHVLWDDEENRLKDLIRTGS